MTIFFFFCLSLSLKPPEMAIKFKTLVYPVCRVPKYQVCLQSFRLKGYSNTTVLNILKKCSLVNPVAVFKDTQDQQYCHVSFKDKATCSIFYHLYHEKKRIICKTFRRKLAVKPSRENGVPVVYSIALCQEKLDGSPLKGCTCSEPGEKVPPPACSAVVDTPPQTCSSVINAPHPACSNDVDTPPPPPAYSSAVDAPSPDRENSSLDLDKGNHLLKRARTSLEAEIKKDEALLNRKKRRLEILTSLDTL
ncbi:hypothetical protein EDC94DRAFT_94707 [Helicostylum pulchrum]|nr:hypothetical protein EDC94DRAFT_94707 [Helicostylum pulchrum]